jgi:hypothetical protein
MIKILRKYVMSNNHRHYFKIVSYIHMHIRVYLLIFFWLYSPLNLSFLYDKRPTCVYMTYFDSLNTHILPKKHTYIYIFILTYNFILCIIYHTD